MKKLVVVQNRPTQFDVPLYASIHSKRCIDLSVYYTQVAMGDEESVDGELSFAPHWDHLRGLKYNTRYLRSAIKLWRSIVKEKPSYVVICGWYPRAHLILAILLRLSGTKIGVRSDNTLIHTDLRGARGWRKRVLTGALLSLYHSWHPVGLLARGYVEKIGFLRRPVFYFPYAVDVEWFSKFAALARSDLHTHRSVFGLTKNDYVVVGVMKWLEREDPLTLVDAVSQAAETEPRIKLLLVGDGPLRQEIVARAAHLQGRLVIPGYAKYSELPFYYGIADLFVHPARSEPYGVSVQEAMACGLPVIASDMVGASAEFIRPGQTGDTFPVGNAKRLAALLVEWARREDRENIRNRAQQQAREWSYARTLEEFSRCLDCTL